MKLCLKILAIVATAATTYSLVSCAAPASFSYQNVSISLSSQCSDCPGVFFDPAFPTPPNNGSALSSVIPPGARMSMANTGQGGTVQLAATVYNAPANNVTWQIFPQPNLGGITTLPTGTTTPVGESGSSVGSFNTPGVSTTTALGPNVYYANNGVPVYSGAALVQAQAMGICQGCVMIVVSVPSDPDNPAAVVTTSLVIQIYGGSTAQGPPTAYLTPKSPTIPAGLVNPVVTVPHNPSLLSTPSVIVAGGQYQFYGGIVGAAPCLTISGCAVALYGTSTPLAIPLYTVDNTAVWEVGPAPFSLTTAFPCTVAGLSCPFGTVSSTGLYTAPAAIPINGLTPASEVVVVVVSQLVPTVNAYAYILLN
jgi:hypothetical protein